MKRTGLILEGGAMRGMFTAGVIDVMMENGIDYDGVIGVSAGAAFGCNYKSRQPGRVIRYNLHYAGDKRMCSTESLLLTGDLYGGEFCYHTLPDELDVMDRETYRNNPQKFYAVATDVNTGRPLYAELPEIDYDALEFVRASASMPVVSKPVKVYGRELLDGGISDSIPIRAFEKMGYEKNVVVLTRPDGYRKEPQKAMSAMRIALKKYPAVADAMERRYIMYNETLDYLKEAEKAGRAYLIYPEEALQIRRTESDRDVLSAVYFVGRNTMKKHLEGVRRFLGEE